MRMLAMLVGSTCIIGWGNKKSEDAAKSVPNQVESAVKKAGEAVSDAVKELI